MIRELIDAAEADDEKTVKKLIGKGAKVDECVPGGWTPLHGATRKGHKNMVKFLIKHGANVNIKTTKDETPLHMAAFHGQLACAKLLVRGGADLKARSKKGNKTALEMAVQREHADVQKYLETKADSDAKKAKTKKPSKSSSSKKKKSKGSALGMPLFVPPLLVLIFLIIYSNLF